jgi:(R,R)-butanediol dehydrogenase/meso-butanediol dehydrogenase/diacetyl reductase
MNKGIVFYGINKTKIVSKRIPQCKKGHAIIKVKCAGICGTDLIILNGQHARANPGCILGHEFSGVIHKTEGSERKDYKPGNRVVINPVYSCGECDLCKSGNYHICENKGLYGIDQNGGFTQYSRVPLTNLYKIPDSISFEEAALTEPLAVAIRAVSLSKIRTWATKSSRPIHYRAATIEILMLFSMRLVQK